MLVIGDAVHATLPYLAQDAAMAIEDAACLGFGLWALCFPRSVPETRSERLWRSSRTYDESAPTLFNEDRGQIGSSYT
jgi:2-polyprenyl-6-methoxyphenol hydroxylase-like FAD-dependent oxidoreductase